MICLNSEGLYFLDQLKNLRAITIKDLNKEKLYNDCIENVQVYDEQGKFIPYSTIINDIETHKVLCEHYSITNATKRESAFQSLKDSNISQGK